MSIHVKQDLKRILMRILDCKERKCKEITKSAPIILDYMCEECDTHFTKLKDT